MSGGWCTLNAAAVSSLLAVWRIGGLPRVPTCIHAALAACSSHDPPGCRVLVHIKHPPHLMGSRLGPQLTIAMHGVPRHW
jgi:hypothetical protein